MAACKTCCTSCCYQQPPRAIPFRPMSNYVRSNAPMDSTTVYRGSYAPVSSGELPNCRQTPFIQQANLFVPKVPLDCNTIQKLSYQGHCGVKPPLPIIPIENGNLKASAPFAGVTTAQHDYVAKGANSKRIPYIPSNNLYTGKAPSEKCTTNRLSYMPNDVCANPPPKPFIPMNNVTPNTAPLETLTTHKLSYQPCAPAPKEDCPWGRKTHIPPPPYSMSDKCTTYGLSYLPNCNIQKTIPIKQDLCLRLFSAAKPQDNTVYSLSYSGAPGRPPLPFIPQSGLVKPTGPNEKYTTYKLSYIPNCGVPRVLPFIPTDNTCKTSAPIESCTTQKRDFVAKPYSKPLPYLQKDNLSSGGAFEKYTTNRLSYMPVDVSRYPPPKAYIPAMEPLPKGAVSNSTTYKLSYLPNIPAPKEPLPWIQQPNYQRPTAPLETCTIQKLSYMPPGAVAGGNCSCCCKDKQTSGGFPTAAIVKSC